MPLDAPLRNMHTGHTSRRDRPVARERGGNLPRPALRGRHDLGGLFRPGVDAGEAPGSEASRPGCRELPHQVRSWLGALDASRSQNYELASGFCRLPPQPTFSGTLGSALRLKKGLCSTEKMDQRPPRSPEANNVELPAHRGAGLSRSRPIVRTVLVLVYSLCSVRCAALCHISLTC